MIKAFTNFSDGRTFRLGQKVKVIGLSYDLAHLEGNVVGFGKSRGANTVKIQIDNPEQIRAGERWELKAGGYYDRVLSVGAFGGEIFHVNEKIK